jgi:hypothetical protein
MSTLTKPRAKKPARAVRKAAPAGNATKPAKILRSPKVLETGKPTGGFLAGTITVGSNFNPAAPAYAASEWKE